MKEEKKTVDLAEDVAAREVILDLLDSEHRADLSRLRQWTGDVEEYQRHIFALLRCQREDEIRAAEIGLRAEKLRLSVVAKKNRLDERSTENKMAQLSLDKTAADFRRSHDERDAVVVQWQEALSVVKKRDSQLEELHEEVAELKLRVRNKAAELKDEEEFLKNERENVREVEKQIEETEKKSQQLSAESAEKEASLEKLEAELALEERETSKTGAEIASKRVRLKEVKANLNASDIKVNVLRENLEKAKRKMTAVANSAATAEEKADEVDLLLTEEERWLDALRWDLDKLREKRLKQEAILSKTDDEMNFLRIRVKGLRIEKQNLASRLTSKSAELAKKEDLSVAHDYRIAQLERSIAERKGSLRPENGAELKMELKSLKETLAERLADKRNLDHLVHKLTADKQRLYRDVKRLEKEKAKLTAEFEEMTLVSDTSKRRHKKAREELEALLLEDKMLQVNEKKVKGEIDAAGEAILELNQQAIAENEKSRRSESETDFKKSLLQAQQKHLAEDLKAVKSEIRERKDQAEKLRMKYDLLVKSFGSTSSDNESKAENLPSHAHHLIRLAQEKAELAEKSRDLLTKIEKEEKELLGLESAMSMLKNSNGKYRATFAGRKLASLSGNEAVEAQDELTELRMKLRERSKTIEGLKNEFDGIEAEIKMNEFRLLKSDSDLDSAQSVYEDRSSVAAKLDKELTEQEAKLRRAEKCAEAAAMNLKSGDPNADAYERDMDLRSERERQRTALLRLNELSRNSSDLESSSSTSFPNECQKLILGLGLVVPELSRIEKIASSSSSSAGRRIRTASSTSYIGTPGLYRRRSASTSSARVPAAAMLAMDMTDSAPKMRGNHFLPVLNS